MNELMEQPFWIIAVGIITVLILGSGLLKTGQSSLLYALIVAVLAFGGLLATERLVETDREQIQKMIRQVARHVEREEIDAVLEWIHSKAEATRAGAQSVIPRYEFAVARVTKFRELKVNSPTTATAEFTVRLEGRTAGGSEPNTPAILIVVVDLKKEGELWKVFSFKYVPFQAGKISPDSYLTVP